MLGETKSMVEIILFIFFCMVLGPILVVLTYCGFTGHCGENDTDDRASREQ